MELLDMYFVGHPIGQVAYICEAAYPAKILAKYDLTSLHIHTFIQEIRAKTVGLVIRENGAVVFLPWFQTQLNSSLGNDFNKFTLGQEHPQHGYSIQFALDVQGRAEEFRSILVSSFMITFLPFAGAVFK